MKMLSVKVDVEGFKRYSQALKLLSYEWDDFIEGYLTEIGLRVLRKTIPRTPVNKDPKAATRGLLRRSWKLSEVNTEGGDLVIYLTNDAKSNESSESYASFVENGHFTVNRSSFVEGRFMLAISMKEVEEELQKIFDIKLYQKVKELGL